MDINIKKKEMLSIWKDLYSLKHFKAMCRVEKKNLERIEEKYDKTNTGVKEQKKSSNKQQ